MKLKHCVENLLLIIISLSFLPVLAACGNAAPVEGQVEGTIIVDGREIAYQAEQGTIVQVILSAADITLESQDRTIPDQNSSINQTGAVIKVIRVEETFVVEEITIPYSQQTIRNESLTEGETQLVQAGQNGIEEITYRYVYENGSEVSKTIFKTTTIQEAVPEITMIGIKSPLLTLDLPNSLVYLTGGNAWIMEDSTENRRPIVTTGDLDGRVFEISPNNQWLLFTRAGAEEEPIINSLWVASLDPDTSLLLDLQVTNIIHFADWHPLEENTIACSTVEPRETAPGWQANNDLVLLNFDPDTETITTKTILEINAGGLYGWWGTDYKWSSNGDLAYSRPDTLGIVNLDSGELTPVKEVNPYNTREDWAWTPGFAWETAGEILFIVSHPAETGLINTEDSTIFNLSALVPKDNLQIDIVKNAGMFAYPAAAPANVPASCQNKVAFLQAIFPEESKDSRYVLMVMDADGSNRMRIFPEEGSPGLNPQEVKWMHHDQPGSAMIGFIYQGNLWIYDLANATSHQITSDGLTTNLDW